MSKTPVPVVGLDVSFRGEVFRRGMLNTLVFAMDSYWVMFDGMKQTQDELGRDLPGCIGVWRTYGRPYEYEFGEVRAWGTDLYLEMLTSDLQKMSEVGSDGFASAEPILKTGDFVRIKSRNNPDEPPQKFMVRYIDERGDTKSNVYLYRLDAKGQPIETGPPTIIAKNTGITAGQQKKQPSIPKDKW